MAAQPNTNRISKPEPINEDTRVILYKKPGPSPETHLAEFRNMSYIHAADREEADGLIKADGWYETPAEAEAAFKRESVKAKPAAFSAEVQKMLDDLKGRGKDKARIEYAAGLGVDVKDMSEAEALAAIGAALSKAA